MTLTADEVVIANQSLDKIGSTTFTFAVQTSVQAEKCILHYDQTRNSLLESFEWKFASARAVLTKDTNSPPFEWDNQFILPTDFLRLKRVYEVDEGNAKDDRFTIEGNRVLTNESTVSIPYIRKVTDTSEFSPLFTELLIVIFALKLLHPLTGSGSGMMNLRESLLKEAKALQFRARAVEKQQVNVTGRNDWSLARFSRGRF